MSITVYDLIERYGYLKTHLEDGSILITGSAYATSSFIVCPICNSTHKYCLEWREPYGYEHMKGGADVKCRNCHSIIEIRPINNIPYITRVIISVQYVDSHDIDCDQI